MICVIQLLQGAIHRLVHMICVIQLLQGAIHRLVHMICVIQLLQGAILRLVHMICVIQLLQGAIHRLVHMICVIQLLQGAIHRLVYMICVIQLLQGAINRLVYMICVIQLLQGAIHRLVYMICVIQLLQGAINRLVYMMSFMWIFLTCCLVYKLASKERAVMNVRNERSVMNAATPMISIATRPIPPPPNPDYINFLTDIASPKQEVLLLLVDRGFSVMAINFYLASLKPNSITNYLVLTMHPDTCKDFEEYKMNCFYYKGFNSSRVSQFGSVEFLGKMNVRTDMILDALNANFSVLHSDIDMTFFKDPFRAINCHRPWCDMAVLMDTHLYNAGFVLVHPTIASKHIYSTMQEVAVLYPDVHDQRQLNLMTHLEEGLNIHFKLIKLPTDSYQCGLYHYEKPQRFFADTNPACPECVVAHNNWIVSVEAKVYREKELHQWMYDGDEYYTSTSRKYLTYNSPLEESDGDEEVRALKSALAIASILNRTLILPKFNCNGTECPLNCLVRIDKFDSEFKFKYREHAFLDHPLVPKSVLDSKEGPFLIETDFMKDNEDKIQISSSVTKYTPENSGYGMDDEEIRDTFKKMDPSILVFHSMFRAFAGFKSETESTEWEEKVKNAIERADYRQYTSDQKDKRIYCGVKNEYDE